METPIDGTLQNMILHGCDRPQNTPQDRLPGQDPWKDSVMMVFGNVFAFNAALVQNMQREWGTIGQVPRLLRLLLLLIVAYFTGEKKQTGTDQQDSHNGTESNRFFLVLKQKQMKSFGPNEAGWFT